MTESPAASGTETKDRPGDSIVELLSLFRSIVGALILARLPSPLNAIVNARNTAVTIAKTAFLTFIFLPLNVYSRTAHCRSRG